MRSSEKTNLSLPTLAEAFLARAVFDNVAESPQELTFNKGEILQVLERNPSGYHGWWLCRLRGQDGLAASNRLQILGTKNGSQDDYDVPKPILSEKGRGTTAAKSRRNDDGADYDIPKPIHCSPDSPPYSRSSRLSGYFLNSHSPFAPSNFSSSGSSSGSSRFSCVTSDLGSSERNSVEPFIDYELSSCAGPRSITSPEPPTSTHCSSSSKDGDYDYIDADIKVNIPTVEDHYDRLPQRNAQLPRKGQPTAKNAKKRDSFLRSARLYDVLPKQIRPVNSARKAGENGVKLGSLRQTADEVDGEPKYKDLPIYEPLNVTKQTAVTRITFMQSQVQTELSRLFSFVTNQKWRETSHLENRLVEVKLCCDYLICHLKNLVRFVLQAALASAKKSTDSSLESKLNDLITTVHAKCGIIRKHLINIEMENWTASDVTVQGIEGVVATGQVLSEDVRKMTAFVLGNAQLIFPETEELKIQLRPLPNVPAGSLVPLPNDIDDNEYEDVDYGNLSTPVQPRSPTLERKILNSYIHEVNEEVSQIRPLILSFVQRMFGDKTVTSVDTINEAEMVATRTAKLSRLTESLYRNLTSMETEELRNKLKKTGTYISTACKRFNLELRTATKFPDDAHFRNVKSSLDYLNELCLFLKNATETEV